MRSSNMKMYFAALVLLVSIGITSPMRAATYVVDLVKGSDSNPGTTEAPFKTIAKGIKKVQPGDTVKILKVDYLIREMITIKDKSGENGKPIILDGCDNLFSGSDLIRPEDWTLVRPGVYRNGHITPLLSTNSNNNAFIYQRYFMLWDGVQNRMGRSSKGSLPPFVKVEALKPGEWTCVPSENAFYIAIDPQKRLADYQIEAPVRLNGLSVIGKCEHWIVRNVNATHVINDGFNLHGHINNFLFEHITATECGDDGISQHEDCEITIHGLVSRRNSTGICHGGGSSSTADNVVLEDNFAGNLILYNGTYVISNSTISCIAPEGGYGGIRLLNVTTPPYPDHLSVQFVNCAMPFPAKPNPQGQPPFLSVEGTEVTISSDCKLGGAITTRPKKNK